MTHTDPLTPNLCTVETEVMREHALRALRENDVGAFLITVSSDARLALVCDNMHLLRQRGLYEEALLMAYSGCRVNHRNWSASVLQYLFGFADRDKLREVGDPLPGAGPFTIYRGVSGVGAARRLRGLSWTGSLDIACWFACRFPLGTPAVVTATIDAADVYACITDRDEDEFVCRPAKVKRMKLSGEEIKAGAARYYELKQKRQTEEIDAMMAKHAT